MEPLRHTDPPWVGRHRVLRRLGAGGMGVVYLARSPGGALAAVKVIRAGYADDHGFRARFRREVETAGRVRSPWVVPLLDADPDAESPWLATAFVAGPALAEVVEECGPLPLGPARLLGARLAEALDAVHGAGLVHRDVKPGNVLIAHDGPRLIDFGIAREPDDTALTATGMVVGSPGFLSPEQARGHGIGPPSDVFSLGCLLAHAVTGVRPFGGGSPAAMLSRTVYDEPDLDRVPAALRPLLRSCLEKDPASRPTAAQVHRALEAPGAWDGDDRLPEPVLRLIARRSAEVLALPAIEATEVPGAGGTPAAGAAGQTASGSPASTPAGPAVPATGSPGSSAGPTRRRFLVLGSAAGAVSVGATAAWWAADRSRKVSADQPPTTRPTLVIAVQADLSGPRKAAGVAQRNGVQLAVEQFNSRAENGFLLELKVHDDGGEAVRARRIAEQLAADDRVRAVIGPTTDACATAVDSAYQRALLPTLWVSVGMSITDLPLPSATIRAAVPTSPTDAALAGPLVAYISRVPGARSAVLIDDRAEGDFGSRLCAYATESLRSAGAVTPIQRTLAAGDDDFASLAAYVVAKRADAVVFTGGPDRTAGLARALHTAGFQGARLATRRALDPAFVRGAGGTPANDWLFATTFIEPTAQTSAKSFVSAYRKRFGGSPPWYAAEAHDAAMFAATAMTTLGSSGAERSAILRQLRETEYHGITKTLRYSASTAYVRDEDALYFFRCSAGRFRFLGHYQDALP